MGISLDTFKRTLKEFSTQIKKSILSSDVIKNGDGILISRHKDGNLTISVDDANLMKTSKYASLDNIGSVKLADEAIGIKNAKLQHSLMYYGTDKDGNIGAHFLPMTAENLESGMYQTTLLNAAVNVPQYLPTMCDLSDCKLIVQGYQFVVGEQNVVNTIKYFNNGNKDSFYYNENVVKFGEDMSIKNNYTYSSTKVGDLYESEEIDKTQFLNEMVVTLNG